jgi:hypothetical protein
MGRHRLDIDFAELRHLARRDQPGAVVQLAMQFIHHHARTDDRGAAAGDGLERFAIEVIAVLVGVQHQIWRRQRLEPHQVVGGIEQDGQILPQQGKAGVADRLDDERAVACLDDIAPDHDPPGDFLAALAVDARRAMAQAC